MCILHLKKHVKATYLLLLSHLTTVLVTFWHKQVKERILHNFGPYTFMIADVDAEYFLSSTINYNLICIGNKEQASLIDRSDRTPEESVENHHGKL